MIDKIQPSNMRTYTSIFSPHRPVSPLGHRSESTLVSSGGVSLFGILTWPFRLVGRVYAAVGSFLQNYICCCFERCGMGFSKLDWEKIGPTFAKIYEAVITSTSNEKDRKKRFDSSYKKLSAPAKKRFREHIALAHARKETRSTEVATLEKWIQGKDIPTERYLSDLSNAVLKDAVEKFQTEIREKTAKS